MGSHDEYCREKAAPAGSNTYYATLYEPAQSRPDLIPLFALHNEFIDCLTVSPDPGVTRLKFSWWHEELSRLSENSPRHPVTQTLDQSLSTSPDTLNILHNHLVCIESIITGNASRNFTDWYRHYITGLGRFWLCANQVNDDHPHSPLIIENGGIIFNLEILTNYRLFADKTMNFLPTDLVENHSVNDHLTDTSIIYTALFDEILSRFKNDLADIYNQFRSLPQRPALFNGIYNNLARVSCEEIQQDGNRIMLHKIHLTPLRKLWISFITRLTY